MAKKNLKPGWKVWRFEQMARMINDRIDDPSKAGSDYYVGLEHLDSGSLKVRRWGKPTDVEATKLRFRKGDIIFGRRRAYQRKLAVADFDGICSAHAMVLRARTEVAQPEFLPFFMQSDLFMKRAIEISVGSLSPTINWRTLAAQEFALPPLIEQEGLVGVLKGFDAALEALRKSASAAQQAFRSMLDSIFSDTRNSWPRCRLDSIAAVSRGRFSHRPRNLPEFYGGPYPFVQTGDIVGAQGYISTYAQTLSDAGKQYSKSFPQDTILITIAANIGHTAITSVETWCTDSVVGIVPTKGVSVQFLEYFLRSKQPYLEKHLATQTAQKNINLEDLRPLEVSLPDHPIQEQVAEQLSAMERARLDCSERQRQLLEIREQLMNGIIPSPQ